VDEHAGVAILSEPLAERLVHAQSPLGQMIFLNGRALVVVGVCAPLAGPQFRGRPETNYTLILPGAPVDPASNMIMLRVDRGDALLENLLDRLNATTAGRIVWTMESYQRIRADYFQADRAVTLGLSATVLAVALTSLCGVLGLTRYWIGRRQAQIAVRRALGGRRGDIFRHFLAESGWLVGCGLVLGCFAAVAAGRWTGLFQQGGLDAASLLISLTLTFGLSILAVYLSLYRLLRLQPIELARNCGS
jgi:putative ABC transport system permease protein